jgi:hypothetical protein
MAPCSLRLQESPLEGDRLLAPAAAGIVRVRPPFIAAVVAALALAFLPAITLALPSVRADEVTVSQNDLRTSWDSHEPALTQSALSGGRFGQLFSTAVNGQVYAQPLVVGSTVIVATENDWVYGLNSATGAVNWSLSLGTPWNTSAVCGDLTPDVGVTSTPVYNPATGTVYLVAATMAGSAPQYHLYGISPQTGAITTQVAIGGSPSNDSSITFNPAQQWQRTGLLLMNGWVYAGFASHCDNTPYDGFVAGVNVSTQATTLWSDETGVTDNQAGIWQGGGGLMSDGPGRIFFVSGNGVSPAPGPGTAPPGQLAESVVRLAVQSNGSLAAQDFFSPTLAPLLDAADLDFGAGGPVALPFGTSTYPDMMVAAGKSGSIYLLNRNNLGGREQGLLGTDAALRVICCVAGEWGHPAAFADTPTLTSSNTAAANDFLYYVGNTDYLREMKWGYSTGGVPVLNTVATSSFQFGYTSGSPVVTSNGTSPSSAIVWAVGATGSTGAGGTLYAFSAVPASTCTSLTPCTLTPLWSAPIGTASKFTTPATDSGHVYVGTRDGHVLGFGITAPAAASLTGAKLASFGQTPVGGRTSQQVSVTASAKVTVSGVSASSVATASPYSAGTVTKTAKGAAASVPVTFPVTLAKGDALHVPVTFAPSSPGGVAGALSFATNSARVPSVNVPLSGNGTRTGLYARPGSQSFALASDQGVFDVPVGITVPKVIEITNGGTSTQTVTAVTPPSGEFSASGLPARGTKIAPGQSVMMQVTFAPRQAGPAASSLTIRGNSGTSATVGFSGTGARPVSQFTPSAQTVKFGSVPAGTKATATVRVTNTGNQPAIIASSSSLGQPFAIRYQVVKGLPVNGGYDLRLVISFRPARTGTFRAAYRLTWTDPLGRHAITVTLSGTGVR